jgi:methyl-accepting chemotaxis protein
MPVLSGAAVIFFQESERTSQDIHWAMIFLAIIAVSVAILVVCVVVGGVVGGVFAAKLAKQAGEIAEKADRRVGPLLDMTNELLVDLTPKLQALSTNAEQISYTVREKVDELSVTVGELNETVREINGRARVQVVRVDGIVTDALVATEEISQTVQNGIKAPVRQIAGVIAGLRAGLETLIERSPFKGRD